MQRVLPVVLQAPQKGDRSVPHYGIARICIRKAAVYLMQADDDRNGYAPAQAAKQVFWSMGKIRGLILDMHKVAAIDFREYGAEVACAGCRIKAFDCR